MSRIIGFTIVLGTLATSAVAGPIRDSIPGQATQLSAQTTTHVHAARARTIGIVMIGGGAALAVISATVLRSTTSPFCVDRSRPCSYKDSDLVMMYTGVAAAGAGIGIFFAGRDVADVTAQRRGVRVQRVVRW
ncbi:MAG TPA: hypothetical protein VFA59_24045 [Vicinamibacterales bacterium]|nr:hypothetical protein [Vicinamibacterales bacterium]